MLDAGSLAVLGAHFERLMVRIQERVDYVGLYSPALCFPRKTPQQVGGAHAFATPQQPRRRFLILSVDPILMIHYVLALSPNHPFNHRPVPQRPQHDGRCGR